MWYEIRHGKYNKADFATTNEFSSEIIFCLTMRPLIAFPLNA